MKKLVESEGNHLEALMGERITLFCLNYIYTGKLIGVDDECVALEDPAIVFETGAFNEKEWKDAQPLPGKVHYVVRGAVESFGKVK